MLNRRYIKQSIIVVVSPLIALSLDMSGGKSKVKKVENPAKSTKSTAYNEICLTIIRRSNYVVVMRRSNDMYVDKFSYIAMVRSKWLFTCSYMIKDTFAGL